MAIRRNLSQAYTPEQYAELAKLYAAQPQDAGMSDRDLAELFSRGNTPVYSIGQGIAEAGGKIGEAYFRKQAREKEQKQQAGDYRALAEAMTGASAPMNIADANQARGMAPAVTDAAQSQAMTEAPDNMKLAALMQGVPDRVKMQALPAIQQEMARANPQFTGTVGLNEDAYMGGQKVASGPRTPAKEDSKLLTPAEEEQYKRLHPPAAGAQEPLVQVPDPNDPTKAIFVTRSDALGKHAFQTPRDRMPKMQTYFGEDGSSQQLDSNDPEDQKAIKERGLVTTGPSDVQRSSKGYLDRMSRAETEMMKLINSGFDPANTKDSAVSAVVPGGYGTSDQYKQFWQLAGDWYRAKLRKESGAVIGDQETKDEVKAYFPRASDDDTTKANKTKSRMEAQRQFATASGILGKPRLRELDQSVPDGPLDYSKMPDEQIKAALAARSGL